MGLGHRGSTTTGKNKVPCPFQSFFQFSTTPTKTGDKNRVLPGRHSPACVQTLAEVRVTPAQHNKVQPPVGKKSFQVSTTEKGGAQGGQNCSLFRHLTSNFSTSSLPTGGGVPDTVPSLKRHTKSYLKPNAHIKSYMKLKTLQVQYKTEHTLNLIYKAENTINPI